ncbi:hypothetical protein M407DRAFT_11455 [Tulasnella calospora MUT 4182]|uniref:Uncharacterized protein n=1 Tax=Tulasnella calospora MUT 4182 TaxID=1051891 RepID=A0A0C3Q6D1_9AGAM|nr:hypothetical protein M407DRAFT_11455 [Tulasnella calospora MUT 4182]
MGDILPKDLKQGCLQYLKAYRGAPGSLSSRGELPAVIELGYFEDVGGWSNDDSVSWPDIILGLPTNFSNLKTLGLGSFNEINNDHIKALTAILPVLPLERLDLVNFTPLPVSEELALVQSFHSLCPTICSIRLSSYNGDWRYLPQYEVWTTEDYDQRKLEEDARAKQPMSDRNRVTLPDTVKRIWNAAEVKLRFPRE